MGTFMEKETFTEYGVFVWHGSAEMLYKTFKQVQSIGLWRSTISPEEARKISSIRTREVMIHRGMWSPGQ